MNPLKKQLITAFDSNSKQYSQYFQWFLESTNQKQLAREWLNQYLNQLPPRETCLDIGAGNGEMFDLLNNFCSRYIAIEPNESLASKLAKKLPSEDIIKQPIQEVKCQIPPVDFILLSHVMYYILRSQWKVNLDRCLDWLKPQGTLIAVLQNPRSDSNKMVRSLLGNSYSHEFQSLAWQYLQSNFQVAIDSRTAWIVTDSIEKMSGIAIFLINTLYPEQLSLHPNLPNYGDVEEWLLKNALVNGKFKISCSQDFIQISKTN